MFYVHVRNQTTSLWFLLSSIRKCILHETPIVFLGCGEKSYFCSSTLKLP